MRTLRMKAYEVYIVAALALSTWAVENPRHDYAEAAAGAAVALAAVGIVEAIQRRFKRPDTEPCRPPKCYCGVCENCQNTLRLEGVIKETLRVDSERRRQ